MEKQYRKIQLLPDRPPGRSVRRLRVMRCSTWWIPRDISEEVSFTKPREGFNPSSNARLHPFPRKAARYRGGELSRSTCNNRCGRRTGLCQRLARVNVAFTLVRKSGGGVGQNGFQS